MTTLRSGLAAWLLGTLACVSTQAVEAPGAGALMRDADGLFQLEDYRGAARTWLAAAVAARAEGQQELEVRALASVALALALGGEVSDAQRSLDRATSQADVAQPEGWATVLLARGALERERGQQAQALATFAEAYTYAFGRALHARAVQAAHMATLVCAVPSRASWLRRAIAAAEVPHAHAWLAELWTRLAWTEEDAGHHERALEAFVQAREHVAVAGAERELMKADWALAHGERLAGRPLEAHRRLERTLASASSRYAVERSPNDAEWVAHCERELGELALAAGEPRRALAHFARARTRFLEAGIAELAPQSLAQLDARMAAVARDLATPVPR